MLTCTFGPGCLRPHNGYIAEVAWDVLILFGPGEAGGCITYIYIYIYMYIHNM